MQVDVVRCKAIAQHPWAVLRLWMAGGHKVWISARWVRRCLQWRSPSCSGSGRMAARTCQGIEKRLMGPLMELRSSRALQRLQQHLLILRKWRRRSELHRRRLRQRWARGRGMSARVCVTGTVVVMDCSQLRTPIVQLIKSCHVVQTFGSAAVASGLSIESSLACHYASVVGQHGVS